MKDLTGLETSVHSADVLALYNTGIAELCRFKNPLPRIEAALEAEPGFAMALILHANIHLWTTDRDDLQPALDSLQSLLSLSTPLNRREKMHIAALQVWVRGDLRTASNMFDQLLTEYPLDILALLSGHQLDFFLGDAYNLRDRVARVLPEWDSSHPLYGYLLGMLSFGQEEAGHYEIAEENALKSVEMNHGDIWGIHAVAHAREMLNKYQSGANFMRQYEQYWNKENDMITHNAIHLDLFLLETGELDDAVRIYDEYVHYPDIYPAPMGLLDASSVLWRLFLENTGLARRPAELSTSWNKKKDQMFYVFNDAHAVMAYVMNNELDVARDIISDLKDYVIYGDKQQTNHAMVAQTGLPVCEAFYAYGTGDYATAACKLWSVKNTNAQFGGSHAQRDVLARTLLESAIRSGNKALSKALINERMAARPRSPYNLGKLESINAMN